MMKVDALSPSTLYFLVELYVLFGEKETLVCAHCHRQIRYVVWEGGGCSGHQTSMTLLKSKKIS